MMPVDFILLRSSTSELSTLKISHQTMSPSKDYCSTILCRNSLKYISQNILQDEIDCHVVDVIFRLYSYL